MNQFQKTVKYLAMGFAIFLTVVIISGIVSAMALVFSIFNVFNFGENMMSKKHHKGSEITLDDGELESFKNINNIYISHGVGSLRVTSGDTDEVRVYVEDEDNDYRINVSGDTLNIKRGKQFNNFFDFNWNETFKSEVIVTLPKDYNLEKLDIDGGAGDINIEEFSADYLSVDAGAGRMSIKNVKALKVDINGGAGELRFSDVEFNDSKIDSGVGLVDFDGIMLGKNEINAGVGEIKIDIYGNVDDYHIKTDKGLGNIRVNGQDYDDSEFRKGNPDNGLDISGGVGNIEVNFLE